MDNAKLQILGGKAQAFKKLKETPGWQELRQVAKVREEKYGRLLTAAMMRGEPVDQREIDFRRGFFAGMDYLLNSVDHAEKAFEDALKRATQLEETDAA